ncbi:MAG TPA: MFS transporter [Caulobacteraceae bacterium]|nr:MFS transporter [Caulobacteraceae bacterium]
MRRFLASVYAFKLFDALILIYALYPVMFVDDGMTPGEVGVALAVWSVTAFLVQVPAGVWADRWSRRGILAIAQALRLVGFVIWLVYPHFWGFLGGFVLWGVKSGLTGGCFEALVFDELKAAGREADYTRVAGRAEAVSFAGLLAASFLAAPLAPLGYGVLVALSVAASALGAAAAMSFPRAPRFAHAGDVDYLAHLRLGLAQTVRAPRVLGLVAFLTLALVLGGGLDAFWPIFASQAGLTHAGVAIFIGVLSGGQAVASAFAHRARRLPAAVFFALLAISGALLAVAAAFFQPAAMALFVVFVGLLKVIDVVYEGRLQAALPSETRATIASVKSFVVEVGMTALFLTFGPLAQLTSYRTALLVTGALVIGAGLALLARRVVLDTRAASRA